MRAMNKHSRFWFGKYKGLQLWRVIVKDLAYVEICMDIGLIRLSYAAQLFITKIKGDILNGKA